MKIITIGRGENSHIFIDNPLVSRQHAILKINGNGKMMIVDKSSNGTSINGSPIKKEREYPVSRRDVVTFAGVSQLDWKEVPDPLKVFKIIGVSLIGLGIALCVLWGIRGLLPKKEVPQGNVPVPTTTPIVKEPLEKPDDSIETTETTADLKRVLKEIGSGNTDSRSRSKQESKQEQVSESNQETSPDSKKDTQQTLPLELM